MGDLFAVRGRKNDCDYESTELFLERSLSLKTKGFIKYLLIRVKGQTFDLDFLAQSLKIKKTEILEMLDEARKKSFCVKYHTRNEKGHIQKCKYIVSDSKDDIKEFKKLLKPCIVI